jgi:hypothetical protein
VVRIQSSGDPIAGTSVQEVVDVRLGTLQGVEWDLPEGADVRS